MANLRSWIESRWEERYSSPGQFYLIISGVTVLFVGCFIPARVKEIEAEGLLGRAMIEAGGILMLGLLVASLTRGLLLREEQLLRVRTALLDSAFQECCCKPNSIITKAPGAPELVGEPAGKGYCHVCKCRECLEEHFPGAIEERMQERLNDFAFEETYIPEDLAASYITPEALAYLRGRRLDRVGPERFVPLTFTVRKLRK
jgi:hypothetical protein